jgi:hypothetical protein
MGLVAIVLVIGLVAFLARTSRELIEPLAHLEAIPLSLDPTHLPGTPRQPLCSRLSPCPCVRVELRDLGRQRIASFSCQSSTCSSRCHLELHLDHGRILLDAQAV